MKNAAEHAVGRLGRPLSFDRDAALHQAMLLFWRHGYEATSIGDLTMAMGIKPPSLYAAFGDKKRLFLAAVDHYRSGPVTAHSIIENATDARSAAHALLHASVIGFTGADTPAGCLLATGAISCSTDALDVQEHLAAIRREIEAVLVAKIEHDVGTGTLPKPTDSEALAGHVMAVIQGLSTLARDGASRERLARIADMAETVWPGPPATA